MQTPSTFKTSTEKRIELGQDINNAWAQVAAAIAHGSTNPNCPEDVEDHFKDIFPAVRRASAWARAQALNDDKEEPV